MPQDAFTIRYVTEELAAMLVGGKISRIIQPSRDELIFIIYTAKGNVKLEACLSAQLARLNVTCGDTSVPSVAPNFCMLLRKHLQNAEILAIEQPDFERIVYFDLKCVSDFSSSVMRLYFELMGKYSNAVLTENGVIVGALKTNSIGENTRRLLFSGVKYVPPEPQDKISPFDIRALEEAVKIPCSDRAKFICERIKGISFQTAEEMVATYGAEITAKQIHDYVCGGISPCVTFSDGRPTDFKVRSVLPVQKRYGMVLEAQNAYYSQVCAERNFSVYKNRLRGALNSALKKAEKRLADIRIKLEECRGAETVKLKGELITANIYALEKGITAFSAVNYYDPDCAEIKIELDKSLTPSQNAQKYYKRYAKLKRTYTNATAQRSEAEKRLDYLESIAAHIDTSENANDLEEIEEELLSLGLIKNPADNRKKKSAAPYRAYECRGFRIMAGRNNLQNERLTKRLSPDDVWLHTQKYHSSHVGIITEGRKVPDDVLLTAAEICAYYSDGRSGLKIPVDYTYRKYVKKPPKSNAGFVVYTDYKTLLADPNKHTELSEE